MDNQTTPDVSSGHASSQVASSPDVSSGHGANTNGSSNQIQSQAVGNNQSTDWRTEFEKQRNHANTKITELAQANAKYQQELEAIRQQQEAQKNAFAQAFGFGDQKQQQVDYFEQFAQNPQGFVESIRNWAKEVAQQEVQPYAEKITRAELNEFLQYQDNQKQQLKSQLLEQYDPKIVDQVMDFTDIVNPQIVQLQNALGQVQDPNQRAQLESRLYNELASEIRRHGGVEAIVDKKLGRYLRDNQVSLMRSAAQIYQQKSLQSQRSKPLPGYTGGAVQQASSFGTNARSESVYR